MEAGRTAHGHWRISIAASIMSTRNDIIRSLPFADLTAVQVCGGMEPGWKKESVIEVKEIPQVGALSLGRST
jgi:hypothetical protein